MDKTAITPAEQKKEDSPAIKKEISISHSVLSLISGQMAQNYYVIPYSFDFKGRLEVLMANSEDYQTIDCFNF